MSEQRPSDERCPLCDEATVCGHEFHARTSDYRCSCCGRTWSGCACMLNANSKRTQNTEHTDKPNQHFLRVMDTMTGDAIDYDLDRHTFVVFPAAKPDASEQLRTSEPRCVYCKAGEPRGADGWHPGRAHQCMDYVAEPLPSNPQRNIVGELLTQNCDDDSLEVAAAREIERLRRVADAQAVAIEVLEAKFHNLRERLRDVMNSAADVAAPVASNPLHGAYVLIYQARLGLNHKGVVDGVEKWTASADAWMARYEGATADVASEVQR